VWETNRISGKGGRPGAPWSSRWLPEPERLSKASRHAGGWSSLPAALALRLGAAAAPQADGKPILPLRPSTRVSSRLVALLERFHRLELTITEELSTCRLPERRLRRRLWCTAGRVTAQPRDP